MENLNNHREAMAVALNTIDGLLNQLQVTHREKEAARERFAECNYWLARLYGRLEAELVEAAPKESTMPGEPAFVMEHEETPIKTSVKKKKK